MAETATQRPIFRDDSDDVALVPLVVSVAGQGIVYDADDPNVSLETPRDPAKPVYDHARNVPAEKLRTYLEALAETGDVRIALTRSGISYSTAQRRIEVDPDFKRACQIVRQYRKDLLLGVAEARALDPDEETRGLADTMLRWLVDRDERGKATRGGAPPVVVNVGDQTHQAVNFGDFGALGEDEQAQARSLARKALQTSVDPASHVPNVEHAKNVPTNSPPEAGVERSSSPSGPPEQEGPTQ